MNEMPPVFDKDGKPVKQDHAPPICLLMIAATLIVDVVMIMNNVPTVTTAFVAISGAILTIAATMFVVFHDDGRHRNWPFHRFMM